MPTYRDKTGAPCHLEEGKLDGDARHFFMNGQCHALAAAVAEATGWEVALFEGRDVENDELLAEHHVAVVLPDGDLGDADGTHSEDFICNAYDDDDTQYTEISYWNADQIKDLLSKLAKSKMGWMKPELELARTMLPDLFERWGIEMPRPQISSLSDQKTTAPNQETEVPRQELS